MAVKPSATPTKTTRFNPTAQAIAGAAVIAVIVATLLTGNPFRAVRLAYIDYSNTPAAGAPKADPSPTKQPNTPAAAPPPASIPTGTPK